MIIGRLSLFLAGVVLSLCPLFVQPGYAQAGFVYAAVPGPLCADATPCTSAVHVYDAGTARLVIRLPLPPQTAPVSIAVSRDGAYIYVSSAKTVRSQPPQIIEGSMTVIDARHHRLVGTFPTGENAGPIAVSHDGSKVFIASTVTFETDAWKGTLSVVDPVSRTIVQSVGILPGVRHVEISTNPERIVLFGLDPTRFAFAYTSRLTSVDPATLNVISSDVRQRVVPGGLALSADRQRVHALYQSPFEPPASRRVTFDPGSLTVLSDFAAGTYATAPVELPGGGGLLAFDSLNLMRFALDADVSTLIAGLTGPGIDLTVPSGGRRAYAVMFDTTPGPHQFLVGVDLDRNSVFLNEELAVSGVRLTSTPPAVQSCRYGVDSNALSFPVSGGTRQITLRTMCDWEASTDAPQWTRMSSSHGSGENVIEVTVEPHVLTNSRTATLTIGGQLVTITQAGTISHSPFGSLDTPVEGALNLSGAIAVTGWALDDVGVVRVQIYRDPVAGESGFVYVGDARFVDGARPDVEAAFRGAPAAARAGWGLMILSNLLPGGGNGTFRVHAVAEDAEGNRALIGSRSIEVNNASAALPFGAIDTPGQGETVSGVIYNWGWALTPGSAIIPTDGTSIDVMIDGAFAGHPVYGLYRHDIASIFPGYTNARSAVGYCLIDTTMMENGRHTISWIVRDNQGRAQGIGSRYFTVFNH